MAVYFCKVVDEHGKSKEFIREAVSEKLLVRELAKGKMYPLVIEKSDDTRKKGYRKKRYRRATILEFTNTLSLLLSTGLTLKDSLEIVQGIFIKGKLNELSVFVLKQIEKGISFHEIISEIGDSFPPLYNGLIKIGEKVGSLESAFKGLAVYLDQEKKTKEKLIGSLIYPGIVIGVAFVGIVTIITFVLPKIRSIFSQLDSAIPQRIESMIGLVNHLLIVSISIAITALFLYLGIVFIKRKRNKAAVLLDKIALKIPVIGKVLQLRESHRFIFAMETLLAGGYSVEDALLEASNVIKNLSFRFGILEARKKILKGGALSIAFDENPVFPERLSRWISIGEKSGHLNKAFSQLRIYYQSELEKWASRFMSLIEPVLIIIVGVIIFLFIVFFVLPIFSIYGTL